MEGVAGGGGSRSGGQQAAAGTHATRSVRVQSAAPTVLQMEEAWYCMRGLRPTSPSTITQARGMASAVWIGGAGGRPRKCLLASAIYAERTDLQHCAALLIQIRGYKRVCCKWFGRRAWVRQACLTRIGAARRC